MLPGMSLGALFRFFFFFFVNSIYSKLVYIIMTEKRGKEWSRYISRTNRVTFFVTCKCRNFPICWTQAVAASMLFGPKNNEQIPQIKKVHKIEISNILALTKITAACPTFAPTAQKLQIHLLQ